MNNNAQFSYPQYSNQQYQRPRNRNNQRQEQNQQIRGGFGSWPQINFFQGEDPIFNFQQAFLPFIQMNQP